MKKTIIGMMIGMMIIGTGTSFGSPKHQKKHTPKKEVVVKKNHDKPGYCDCKTCRDLVKRHKTPMKKGHCTCKHCKPVVHKSQPKHRR